MRKNVVAGLVAVVIIAGSLGVGYTARDQRWLIHTKTADWASLQDLSDTLHTKFDGTIDDAKLLDSAKAGLVATAGDPYTVY